METRNAVVSGQFYPDDKVFCIREIEECLGTAKKHPEVGKMIAGIVPHAGWRFSGPTAAKVFAQIDREDPPTTFVLFGAVHRWGSQSPSLFSRGAWETPLGPLHINEELAQKMLSSMEGMMGDDPRAHASEHSLEVQLPFIAYLFPGATILPIALPPDRRSHEIGEKIGIFLAREKTNAVVIGTTDLTHYGPGYGFAPKGVGEAALQWAKKVNDAGIIDLAIEMKDERIVGEAQEHHNACGSGAMAATVGAARALGAKRGILLEYTTSHDMMPTRQVSDFVGYAGIVFPAGSPPV
jgi:MEMO1 family protein